MLILKAFGKIVVYIESLWEKGCLYCSPLGVNECLGFNVLLKIQAFRKIFAHIVGLSEEVLFISKAFRKRSCSQQRPLVVGVVSIEGPWEKELCILKAIGERSCLY